MTHDNGSPLTPLQAALAYGQAGLSVIPILADGSKSPAVAWKPYQKRRATEAELRGWFRGPNPPGPAILGGAVSGNLEQIDFDREAESIFPEWCALVEAECPGLVGRLSVVRTPRQPVGYHVRYRCAEVVIPGNTKLAVDPDAPRDEQTLIETRGEGGYALAPGCPPACHENNRAYEHHSGPKLSRVQAITAAERDLLLRCAALFDRAPAAEDAPPEKASGLRAGDDYCDRGPPIRALLEAAGWAFVKESRGLALMRRPGKDGRGWSATIGCRSQAGRELLCVFSSNAAPFPGPAGGKSCSVHNRFTVYTLLHHRGDFKAAAKALAAEGYGEQRPQGKGAKDAGGEFALPPLTLKLAGARKTATRLAAVVAVLRDGQSIDQLTLASSPAGRREPVRLLAAHLGAAGASRRAEIVAVLGRVLAAAEQLAAATAVRAGGSLRDLVGPALLAYYRFSHRTANGLFSEAKGEVRRQDFIVDYPSALVDACAECVDAPRNGQGDVNRLGLLKAIRAEAEIVWSDQARVLPLAADAELAADTETGRQFRCALEKLWKATGTWEMDRNGSSKRASLISRAYSQIFAGRKEPEPSRQWCRILEACSAWWRARAGPDGKVRVYLGMRHEVMDQVKVWLPGVTDQGSLTKLGVKFGVLDPNPPVNTRHRGGDERLAVLNQKLTQQLLAVAGDLEDEREPGEDDSEEGPEPEKPLSSEDDRDDRWNASFLEKRRRREAARAKDDTDDTDDASS
jgi:hypothetical protein